MDILTIAYGIILGIFLTIGDGMAIEHRQRYGYLSGLLTWILMTAVPLGIALFALPLKVAIIGMVVGFVLSLLLVLQSRASRIRSFLEINAG
jgi:hypothetical protein